MKFTGNTMEGLQVDLENFTRNTSYVTEDFENVTILYAKGYDDEIRNTIQYEKIRPCDQESFMVGDNISEEDKKPYRLGFSKIPDEILKAIDPEMPSTANVAFMFHEGEKNEQIYFLSPLATHSMQRIPIEKIDRLSYRRMCLLAENLLWYQKINENPDNGEIKHCRVKMTVRKVDKNQSCIIGFSSKSSKRLDLADYVHMFLKNIPGKLFKYTIKDDKTFVIVLAPENTVKGYNPNNMSDKPCYFLTVSDTGYCEPTVGTGWINAHGVLIQNGIYPLKEKDKDKLDQEFQAALLSFAGILETDVAKMEELKGNMLTFDDPGLNMALVGSIIEEIPQWSDTLGQKAYKGIIKNFIPIRGEYSEYDVRHRILSEVHNTLEADYAKQNLSRYLGAQIIGIANA